MKDEKHSQAATFFFPAAFSRFHLNVRTLKRCAYGLIVRAYNESTVQLIYSKP